MNMLDTSVIEISCPHCGKKTAKAIRSVKNNQDFTCSHCGVTSAVDAEGLRKGFMP